MKVCYNCGEEWVEDFKPGFNEECERCHADLHVCKNCSMYDSTFYNSCREPMAEKVTEVGKNNRCPFFDFVHMEARNKENQDKEASKNAFDSLFND